MAFDSKLEDLYKIAVALYPGGIETVWRKAGGDTSFLFLKQPGRDAWYDAVDLLSKGGGGTTAEKLVAQMRVDFPDNETLSELMTKFGSVGSYAKSEIEVLEFDPETQDWFVGALPDFEFERDSTVESFRSAVDLLIVTVTEVELQYVLSGFEPPSGSRSIAKSNSQNETFFFGRYGPFRAAAMRCEMGTTGPGSATLATEEALRLLEPKLAIMVGIAFGKTPSKQHIGEVLVANAVIPYESRRVGKVEVIRGIASQTDPALLNRFWNAPDWRFTLPDGSGCRVQVGPMLSGEKLIDDPMFKAKLLKEFPTAIGGEMEGAGFYAAARRKNIPCILVKSICDWADGSKNDNYQSLAAATANSYVHYVLRNSNFSEMISTSK